MNRDLRIAELEILYLLSKEAKKKKKKKKKTKSKGRKLTSKPSSEKSLKDWFGRKGAEGGTGGWVDCNTCRNGKCKPCGRQKGEVRSKYPACRPTPASCEKYKKTKGKSWGKGGKKKSKKANLLYFLKKAKGYDIVVDKYEIEDYMSFFDLERDLLDSLTINVDSPIGSKKDFNPEFEKIPFDYGEIKEVFNPADDMGWDVIIVPSQSTGEKSKSFKDFEIVGVVEYSSDESKWKENGEDFPGSNHKLIISLNGEYTDEDAEDLENFFDNWKFNKIRWF